LVGLRASVTELNYSIGLTGNIQLQLDGKASIEDLGTMAAQNADSVAITGGEIEGVAITDSTAELNELVAIEADLGDAVAASFEADILKVQVGSADEYADVPSVLTLNSSSTPSVGASETDLMTFTMVANAMNTNFVGIRITAFGTYASNSNNKTLKLYFGSATILDTGAVAANNKSWQIQATVLRTGASAQNSIATIISDESSIGAYSSAASPSEATTNTILIKVTGTGTSDNDIVQNGLIVEWIKSS